MTRPSADDHEIGVLDEVAEDMARERAWFDDSYRRAQGEGLHGDEALFRRDTDPDRVEAPRGLWIGMGWAILITAMLAVLAWGISR